MFSKSVILTLVEYNDKTIQSVKFTSGIPIIQAYEKGLFIARADLTFDTEKDQIDRFEYQLIPVDKDLIEPDSESQKEVLKWEGQVSEMLDRPLGTAASDFDKISMMCLAEDAFMESTGADYSHQNRGGTRALLKKGQFNYRQIWNAFPFENTLVIAQCKGSEIPGDFYGHKPIESNATYKIVTNSFMKDQWEKQSEHTSLQWQDTGISLRDSILKYIEKRQTIKPFRLTR